MNRLAAAALLFSLSAFCHAEKITFTANKMSGVAGNKNSVTVLKGNAKVNTKTMIINADYIELSGKDFRMIKAEGNISGKNKAILTSNAENFSMTGKQRLRLWKTT